MADGRGVFLATMALYCCILVKGSSVKATQYLLGTGIADITGTPADIEMMGYAMPQQIVGGLHTRLFARAFIFGDDVTVEQNEGKRFVFVSIDACMASQAVTLGVLDKLKEAYGDMYTADNVAISGIHTHAGPAGYLQYVLYTIPTKGFVSENYEIMVDGIFRAISRAHANLAPGHVELVQGELLHANINRSPTAYLANPAAERSRYRHDTDKTMTLLKLRRDDGMGIGAVNWFAVHCTSMNNTNRLISSDNKGQASMMMESWAAAQSRRQPRSNGGATGPGTAAWSRVITDPLQSGVSRHGKHSKHPHPHDKLSKHSHSHKSERLSSDFVAAFAQSNLGDVSPNVQGAFCLDTGKPCEMEHSTCNGRNELCHGRGPAWPDDFNSTAIIAERQLAKALQLWQQRGAPVAGGIDYRHAYIDISNLQVQATNRTRAGRTCTPAMGFSFAAGTTDGPGAFDFIQGQNHSTPFWRVVREFILPPTNEHRECHAPKPILLDTGRGKLPYQWQPTIVDLGLLKLGQLVVLFVPGEFTTMAGRRIREAVKQELAAAYGHDMVVVLAGLTNTYSSYVATWEEYQVQRYEGASTLYGPHTLDAYIQEMLRLARSMAAGKPVDPGPQPPRLVREAEEWSLVPGVVADEAPAGKRFGDVVQDVGEHDYHPGDTVQVKFVSACPRNRIKIEESYLAVERLQDSCWQQLRGSRSPAALRGCALEEAQWHVVHTDADMCTRFLWDRPWVFAVTSYATIEWRIPADTAAGLYRIRHFGTRKTLFQHMSDFSGMSSYFHVTPPPAPVASLARLRVKGPFRAAARLARQTWLLVRRGVRGLLSVAVHELAQ